MHTTIIHPIRKAFCLTCNDYIILQGIYGLSKNEKYGNWCVASKSQLAEWYDLSERSIFNIIKTLELKKLIIKDAKTGWLKTSDEWNELQANTHDWLIAFDGKETNFISGKQKRYKVKSDCRGYEDFADKGMKILHRGYEDFAYNNNKDNNNDINSLSENEQAHRESILKNNSQKKQTTPLNQSISEFEEKEKSSAKKEKEYGNLEINKMLEALKVKIGIDDFADTQRWSRIYAKLCLKLMADLGKDEFVRRLNILLMDSFHRKNCNKIKYVYNNIKGFIELKQQPGTVFIS